MTYFTALDVSLRFVSICIVDDTGEVRYEAKVPAEVHRNAAPVALRQCEQWQLSAYLNSSCTEYCTAPQRHPSDNQRLAWLGGVWLLTPNAAVQRPCAAAGD